MKTLTPISHPRLRPCGSMLLESVVALGFASVLALMMMKASMVSLASNQWTVMQTLTDAYMTRESALASRVPLAEVTAVTSKWPDPAINVPQRIQTTVTIGKLAGGEAVPGTLIRFRTNDTKADDAATASSAYRLYSVLTYKIGGTDYYKTRSILRTQ